MLSAVLLAVLSAPNDVGSHWSWTFENSFVTRISPVPKRSTYTPSISKSVIDVEVTEPNARVVRIDVLQGPSTLRGTSWDIENNYGDALASEVKTKKSLHQPSDETLLSINKATQLLMLPDPLVAASQGGSCTPEVRAAVLKATMQMALRMTLRRAELVDAGADVTCGNTVGRYLVKFAMTNELGNNRVTLQFDGTVDTPPGAQHASFKLDGTFAGDVVLFQKTSTVKVRAVIASTVTPRKN